MLHVVLEVEVDLGNAITLPPLTEEVCALDLKFTVLAVMLVTVQVLIFYNSFNELNSCLIAKVNGNWNLWSSWRSCSKSCGTGSRTRVRSCSDPAPSFGGSDCQGNSIDEEDCNTQSCST